MRHIILIFTFLSFSLNSFTQNNDEQIKEISRKRADKEVAFISKHIKNLSPDDISFLKRSFSTKFIYVAKHARGADVSPEYKKAIYKKSSEWIEAELNKRFSKDETKQILTLFRTRRDHNKKQKN